MGAKSAFVLALAASTVFSHADGRIETMFIESGDEAVSSREVRVWLPLGYEKAEVRYPKAKVAFRSRRADRCKTTRCRPLADGEGTNLAVYPCRPVLADGFEMHRRVLWIPEPQAELLPRLLAN